MATWDIPVSLTLLDGRKAPYTGVRPGDVLRLLPGVRPPLNIKNLRGTPEKPILITNYNGQVVVNSASGWFGFWLQNCQYFRFTGTGDLNYSYGIQVARSQNNGLIFQNKTDNFEFDHLEFLRVDNANIALQGQTVATTTPDYDYDGDGLLSANDLVNRSNYVQRNWHIHHCHFDGGPGYLIQMAIYVGNSNWHNETTQPTVENVNIHDNLIENTAQKCVQVGSVVSGLSVSHNTIRHGVMRSTGDRVAINLNPGCRGEVYNNIIEDTPGTGINCRGISVTITNNRIVRCGAPGTYFDAGISIIPAVQTAEPMIILGNTINTVPGNGVEFGSNVRGPVRVQNNLFLKVGELPVAYAPAGAVVSNNYTEVNMPIVTDLKATADAISAKADELAAQAVMLKAQADAIRALADQLTLADSLADQLADAL